MFVHDAATALSRLRTPEGFLRLRARIGRTGLQDYRAAEIGGPPGSPPDRVVRVYRPPEDVFDQASLESFAVKPVTLDHPPAMIDSGNWKAFAVGHSGPAVAQDGEHVMAELVITDAAAVARAEAGAELSNGYWADFIFQPGQTPNGETYDAVQRNIRGNHIAIVDAGRCGPACRIDAAGLDAAAQDGCGCAAQDASGCAAEPSVPQAALVRVATLDGSVETTPAGAAVIASLRQALDARDREILDLRAAVPDTAQLDRLAAERGEVIEAARLLLGPTFEGRGRTLADIRRLAVARALGAARTEARDDRYIAAAFDALSAAPAANALARHLSVGLAEPSASRDAALNARNLYLSQAWKSPSAGDA